MAALLAAAVASDIGDAEDTFKLCMLLDVYANFYKYPKARAPSKETVCGSEGDAEYLCCCY